MFIDYKVLNKIMPKNKYSQHKIDDLLDRLQQEKYFTKMDLKSEYHQVQVKEEDTWKTTFKTCQGLYEWLVMPFGLCNVPTMFMGLMNDVVCPFIDSFVIVYFDEILVQNATQEEHISHLTQVLETLKKHKLLRSLEKYEFALKYLLYLGYVTGGGYLKIEPTKMEAIMNWKIPTNVYEVRSFIGAAQNLRKFIASFLLVTTSLHVITTSGNFFQWGTGQQRGFEDVKNKINQS